VFSNHASNAKKITESSGEKYLANAISHLLHLLKSQFNTSPIPTIFIHTLARSKSQFNTSLIPTIFIHTLARSKAD